jgi:ADP-heptose:LPS heptosyltransferase
MPNHSPITFAPRRILLVKGHSAGIGDILRSSAAWRALKDRYGEALELHVVLISKDPGYVSDSLMARHHLLASYTVLPKAGKGLKAWRNLAQALEDLGRRVRADLVIDFEPHGMRSTTLVWRAAARLGIPTLGIAEFPFRSWFYTWASMATARFACERDLTSPMEYTDRDFVVLSALGLERERRPIELVPTPQAREFGASLRRHLGLAPDTALIGLNVGCGTPDAHWRRPSLDLISELVAGLQACHPVALLLTGAPFERDVNEAFMAVHRQRSVLPMHDLAGATSLLQLPGVIEQCRLFLSTDSGPYHMAVAQQVPTLALFNRHDSAAYHHHDWVRCVQLVNASDVTPAIEAAHELCVAIDRTTGRNQHTQRAGAQIA